MTLNVNFGAMRTAAEDVRTCHNALVNEKEGLEQFLGTLRQTWTGTAAAEYQQAQTDWNKACDEVNEILRHMFNALEVALGNYTETEAYLRKLWGG